MVFILYLQDVSLGARLAELTRLRLEYNTAKSQLKSYQGQLATLEQKGSSTTSLSAHLKQSASEKSLQQIGAGSVLDDLHTQLRREKEFLLRECRMFLSHAKDPLQVSREMQI